MTYFTRSSLSALLAFSLMGAMLPLAFSEDTPLDEEKEPTPLSDFAPDEIQAARGKRYDQSMTISKVSIKGNRLIESEIIEETMASHAGNLYSRKNLQHDLRRIYNMGYFTEKIKAVPIATNTGIHLRIEVEENTPVTGINIEGNSIVSDEELQAIFAGQTGLPQNIGQLNESIEKIEHLYAKKGYVLARVKAISDDPDGVINLNITEGKVKSINFVGNRKTKDYVVKRMMATKADDLYNEKVLTEDLKRIFSSQTFSDVRRVITVSPEAPDEYDLTIELDEKRTGAFSLGGGLDTGTGVFGSVGYNNPNFGGRGESFNSVFSAGSGIVGRGDSIASARTYQFDVGWSTPSLAQTNNALSTNVYGRDMSSLNVPLGIERRIGTSVTWSKPIKSMRHTAFSLGLGGERVSLREGGTTSNLRDLGITGRNGQLEGGTFLNVTPTIAYDTRDNRFNPTHGWLATSSLTGAYGIGSDSYGTLSANVRKYMKIRKGVTLAMNLQGGQSVLGDMPTFNMFRAGGSNSVRGFREGGLGIGSGFLMGSAEIRNKVPLFGKLKKIPFLESLNSAFFVDAGKILDQTTLISDKDFKHDGFGISAGAGLRITIPGVGPLRLDYALPISGGNSNFYRKFSFGVGQKF